MKFVESAHRTNVGSALTTGKLSISLWEEFALCFRIVIQKRIATRFHDLAIATKFATFQMNPTWNASGFFRLDINFVELNFVATLAPLSLNRFTVSKCKDGDKGDREQTQIFCLR